MPTRRNESLPGWFRGNYFEVVGTRPALGRFFLPEEDRTSGTHPVIVLNHEFWSRRFGQNPDIVGQTLRVNNRPYTVIGVAEPGFTGTTFIGADFWVPMAMDAQVRASDRSLREEHRAGVDDRTRTIEAGRHQATGAR